MSWWIHVTGTREGVIKRVKEATATPETNAQQLDAARALILAEIAATPSKFGYGFKLEASGHVDEHSRNMKIELMPQELV